MLKKLEADLENSNNSLRKLETEPLGVLGSIADKGLANNLPSNIQELCASHPARVLTKQIRPNIDQRREQGYARIYPKIKQLSRLKRGLDPAFSLIQHLGKKSYLTSRWEVQCYSVFITEKRKSVAPADDLFLELLKRGRRQKTRILSPQRSSRPSMSNDSPFISSRQAKGLGIGGHIYLFMIMRTPPRMLMTDSSPRIRLTIRSSQSLMSLCGAMSKEKLILGKYHEGLRWLTEQSYNNIKAGVEVWNRKDGFECSSYRLGTEMECSAQRIRRLAYMAPDGAQLALQLAFDFGTD
ncbi:uncharacterized protein PAC_10187 [Phialocephala subalpina]|uniref:Uncharacterized protein n=1 Tax=Phialocephala subalpina TaxID=576137 RepID=A0A1L7X5L5_9HELO|nr:uncharacterized protein PAC_10187 [Phialocephala subalpina]